MAEYEMVREISGVRILKSGITKLPKEEQGFILLLDHLLTGISVLRESIQQRIGLDLYKSDDTSGEDIHSAFLLKVLASHIHKGWKDISSYIDTSHITYTYVRKVSRESRKSLKKISEYFSNPHNSIYRLLKSHSVLSRHRERSFKKKSLDISTDNVLTFYFDGDDFQTADFLFGDSIMAANTIFSAETKGDIASLVNEITENVCEWIHTFGNECLKIILNRLQRWGNVIENLHDE